MKLDFVAKTVFQLLVTSILFQIPSVFTLSLRTICIHVVWYIRLIFHFILYRLFVLPTLFSSVTFIFDNIVENLLSEISFYNNVRFYIFTFFLETSCLRVSLSGTFTNYHSSKVYERNVFIS